jgi:hypothetical protein
LPPSVQDYLPEEHLARFVVDIFDQLDLRALSAVYAGKGKAPYHPAMLLLITLLILHRFVIDLITKNVIKAPRLNLRYTLGLKVLLH